MTKIGIIIGSTRDARVGNQVAEFVLNRANAQNIEGVDFEIVDLKDFDIPMYNEPLPTMMLDEYSTQGVKDWSAKIDGLDGFIFVTPEYNKSIPASLKNAIDNLAGEWANKSAGIVAYGSTLGVAASLSLRQVFTNLQIADVSPFGAFSLFTDFENMSTFKPAEIHNATIDAVITDTVAWATALKSVRA